MNKFIATEQFVDEITRLKEAYVLLEDVWVYLQRDTLDLMSLPDGVYRRFTEMFGDPHGN